LISYIVNINVITKYILAVNTVHSEPKICGQIKTMWGPGYKTIFYKIVLKFGNHQKIGAL